jgi:dCMP deaminase
MSHCYHRDDDDRPCVKAVHAEVNCIAFAARHGLSTNGAVLFSTHSPCFECAKVIINAGIVEAHFKFQFRNEDGVELLKDAGITISEPF